MRLLNKPVPLFVTLACMVGSAAADWALEPYAKSSLVHDDNVRFSRSDKESSTGVKVELGTVISIETEAVKTQVTPRFIYSGSSAEGDLDSFDQYLDFSTNSFGERSDLGLNLQFVNDSTLTSELEDSGVVSINKRRNKFSMEPTWRYLLTQRFSMAVRYRFEGSQYEDSGENGLNDFENQRANVDLERRLSEDSDFITRAYYQRYKAIELTNKASTVGVELGYEKRFSERTEGAFFVGGYQIDSTIEAANTDSQGISAKISMIHKDETQNYWAEFSSSVVPSSSGEVFTQNSLRARTDAKLTEKLGWGASGIFQVRETINDTSELSKRTYFYLRPFIGWKLTREWTLEASYAVSGESLEGADDVNRNQVNFSIEYRLPKNTL